MSDDQPNQNNNPNPWDNPQTSAPEVSNPPNSPNIPNFPNNNTVDPVQSWVAQHEQRDASGKFIASNHLTNDINRQVMVKGNMTAEANVIEVKEINIFDTGDKSTPVYSNYSNPAPILPKPTTDSGGQTTP